MIVYVFLVAILKLLQDYCILLDHVTSQVAAEDNKIPRFKILMMPKYKSFPGVFSSWCVVFGVDEVCLDSAGEGDVCDPLTSLPPSSPPHRCTWIAWFLDRC